MRFEQKWWMYVSTELNESEENVSKYQKYAKEVDVLARTAFTNYTKAEARLIKAQQQAKAFPRGASHEISYQAKAAAAEAEVAAAKDELIKAKQDLEGVSAELNEIRSRLVAEVEDSLAADPSQVDLATVELLKSGTLKANEYERLMRKAQAAENTAMIRLAGKYAMSAASAAEKEYGADHPKARELREIGLLAEVVDNDRSAHILNQFDYLASALETTSKNPAMIQDWESLTSAVVDSF